MYGGLAVSQNTQTYPGIIPVRIENLPDQTFVLTYPDPITLIRYFAPSGVPVIANSFLATVDLAGVQADGGFVTRPIVVTPLDDRIRILGQEPLIARIELDRIESKDVEVRVARGTVPAGLTLGDTTLSHPTVRVTGPASVVRLVVAARADIQVNPVGLDVDQDVKLTAIDALGNAVVPVELTPDTTRVQIPVINDEQTKSIPVHPVITGVPAAGFEIAAVTVAPQVLLVAGDADALAELPLIDTEVIPMTGVSADQTVSVGLALPNGVVPVGAGSVRVTITLRPVTGTRNFSAGLVLVGARSDQRYEVAVDRVILTVGGSSADLDRLSGATIVANLDVTGLRPGTKDVPVTVQLRAGTTLVAASPTTVSVTISAAPASVAPSASPPGSPSPAPSGG
jgi:YbbR domain-containing protein